jgi:hypothetical protein
VPGIRSHRADTGSLFRRHFGEGHGRFGRDRTHHRRISYASAKEVDCHLRFLCLFNTMHRDQATTALQIFDDVRAMTRRLLHPLK